jgi:hypothetical protein
MPHPSATSLRTSASNAMLLWPLKETLPLKQTTEGGVTSNLFTVKVQDWLLPLSSMAMMVTVIGPACETEVPGAGI